MGKHEQQRQCVPCTEYKVVCKSVKVLFSLLGVVNTECTQLNRSEVASLLWELFSFGNVSSGFCSFKY